VNQLVIRPPAFTMVTQWWLWYGWHGRAPWDPQPNLINTLTEKDWPR